MMLSRMTLSDEHAQLDAVASELVGLCADTVPRADLLATTRWRLQRMLAVHLAKEDKLLYPALARSPDAQARALAAAFAEEWGGLNAAFVAWMRDWPGDRIVREWRAFGEETRSLVTVLRQRISREERLLYPHIDTLAASAT